MYFLTDQCNVIGRSYIVKVYGQQKNAVKCSISQLLFLLQSFLTYPDRASVQTARLSGKAVAVVSNIAELHTFKCWVKHISNFRSATQSWSVRRKRFPKHQLWHWFQSQDKSQVYIIEPIVIAMGKFSFVLCLLSYGERSLQCKYRSV